MWLVLDVRYKYHIVVRFVLLSGEECLPLRLLSDTRSLEIFLRRPRPRSSLCNDAQHKQVAEWQPRRGAAT